MKTVLAPIDFSAPSMEVVASAISLARGADARLVLLHVVPPVGVLSSDFAETSVAAERTESSERAASARLAELQRELRNQGVTAHTVRESGPVAERILQQAERLDANYLVMGSHGHGALYGLILGSTTNAVLKRATCPVVIVPPAGLARREMPPAAASGALTAQREPAPARDRGITDPNLASRRGDEILPTGARP